MRELCLLQVSLEESQAIAPFLRNKPVNSHTVSFLQKI